MTTTTACTFTAQQRGEVGLWTGLANGVVAASGYVRRVDALLAACAAVGIRPTPVVESDPDDGTYTIWLDWAGDLLDRTRSHGISTGRNRTLAQRLLRAAEDGAVWDGDISLCIDTADQTYVQAHVKVMGRYLNADLSRLGY